MADFDVRSLNPGDKLDCASSFGYFYLTEVVSKTDSAITVEMKSPSGPLVETIPFTSSSRFAALGTHTSKVRYDLPPAEESDAPAPASAVVPPPGAPVESGKSPKASEFDMVDDPQPPTEPSPIPSVPSDEKGKATKECANCRKAGAKLKCGKCSKVVYCNRECQTSDWTFHKRICTKPKPKEESKPAPAPAPAAEPKAEAPAQPKKSSGTEELHVSDDEDAAAIKEASRGYRYFARKLNATDSALIGDITPKALPIAAPAPAPSAAVSLPAPSPVPIPTAASTGGSSTASAWNSAGTFEERDFSKWFKDRLKEIVKPTSGPLTFDAGSAELVITGLDEYEGSASIVFLRGAPRRIFDVKFKAVVEVRTRDVSLADGGAAPAPPEESKEKDGKDKKKKKKAFDNKVPKALLEFHDVSNGADGEYESTVAWGSPAPIDSLKEAVRSTLNSKVKAAVTDAVATVVSEFMTK